ncbi:hypothetical protein A2U01_0106154, partial [Trifolium medium]|nr:hypothetical protein [Trifolium medium]
DLDWTDDFGEDYSFATFFDFDGDEVVRRSMTAPAA